MLDTAAPGPHTFTAIATSQDGLTNTQSITYSVVLQAPTNISPPAASTMRKDLELRCSPGMWTGDPTQYSYQWRRWGAPIPGATNALYKVRTPHAAASLTCAVSAANSVGRGGPAISNAVLVGGTGVHGCPAPTGQLEGSTLGLVRLGMTRAAARAAYRRSTRVSTPHTDLFCLVPAGVLVGYPSRQLLRLAPPGARPRLRGRVVWALTENPFYALNGINPKMSRGAVASQLAYATLVRAGGHDWYFLADGSATGVIEIVRGVVRRVGIVAAAFGSGPAAERVLVAGFPA
jgi:hypothetical protein